MNRGWRFCRPLPYHLATAPIGGLCKFVGSRRPGSRLRRFGGQASMACQPKLARCQPVEGWLASRSSPRCQKCERRLERETGFEPATSTLARSHSTTELFPLARPLDQRSAAPIRCPGSRHGTTAPEQPARLTRPDLYRLDASNAPWITVIRGPDASSSIATTSNLTAHRS